MLIIASWTARWVPPPRLHTFSDGRNHCAITQSAGTAVGGRSRPVYGVKFESAGTEVGDATRAP